MNNNMLMIAVVDAHCSRQCFSSYFELHEVGNFTSSLCFVKVTVK